MLKGRSGLAPPVSRALEQSFLAALPAEIVGRLTAGALRLSLPAGCQLSREMAEPPIALVLAGLLRVYLVSPAGRQVTVRYARMGDVIGVAALVGGPGPVSIQALTDSALLVFNEQIARELGRREAALAWAIAEELARLLYTTTEILAGNIFGSVRQRVARHLLDLAAGKQHSRQLIAPVSQQELADAVGSVREVVARVLRELRDEGLVRTTPEGVLLLDAARLSLEADAALRPR